MSSSGHVHVYDKLNYLRTPKIIYLFMLICTVHDKDVQVLCVCWYVYVSYQECIM